MRQISITIPYETEALISAANMLKDLATPTATEVPPPPITTEAEVEVEAEVEPDDDELDSSGVPHDPRIHTKSRTRLAKTGRWKRIRGVNQEYADSIEKRALDGIPEPDTSEEITTFPQLMQLIARLGLASEVINSVVISCGAESLPSLGSEQELIPAVAEALRKYEP